MRPPIESHVELMEKMSLDQPAAVFLTHQSLGAQKFLAVSSLQQVLVGKRLEELLCIHSLGAGGCFTTFQAFGLRKRF